MSRGFLVASVTNASVIQFENLTVLTCFTCNIAFFYTCAMKPVIKGFFHLLLAVETGFEHKTHLTVDTLKSRGPVPLTVQ